MRRVSGVSLRAVNETNLDWVADFSSLSLFSNKSSSIMLPREIKVRLYEYWSDLTTKTLVIRAQSTSSSNFSRDLFSLSRWDDRNWKKNYLLIIKMSFSWLWRQNNHRRGYANVPRYKAIKDYFYLDQICQQVNFETMTLPYDRDHPLKAAESTNPWTMSNMIFWWKFQLQVFASLMVFFFFLP